MYASSMDQECHVVNHGVAAWCCSFCVVVITRRNIRKKYGIAQDTAMDWLGDALLSYLCGPCAMAQELRVVEKKDWDWVGAIMNGNGIKVQTDVKLMRD